MDMKLNKFVFYSDILDTTRCIQLEQVKYKLDEDTLLITPFCIPDSVNSIRKINFVFFCPCVYIIKERYKTIVPFSIPERYRKKKIIIINDEACKYYLKNGRKKHEYHLYKIESK